MSCEVEVTSLPRWGRDCPLLTTSLWDRNCPHFRQEKSELQDKRGGARLLQLELRVEPTGVTP